MKFVGREVGSLGGATRGFGVMIGPAGVPDPVPNLEGGRGMGLFLKGGGSTAVVAAGVAGVWNDGGGGGG